MFSCLHRSEVSTANFVSGFGLSFLFVLFVLYGIIIYVISDPAGSCNDVASFNKLSFSGVSKYNSVHLSVQDVVIFVFIFLFSVSLLFSFAILINTCLYCEGRGNAVIRINYFDNIDCIYSYSFSSPL